MTDLEALRTRWLSERPKYERLCLRIGERLQAAAKKQGLPCDIHTRAKELDSLLKKALRKEYADPFKETTDKAGVRIVCIYRDLLGPLEQIVREQLDVVHFENKTLSLGYDRLGYLGIHFEVKMRAGGEGACPDLNGLICEVQLLTRAQSLWADVSHELAYKAAQEPPEEIKRAIHLQGAVVELFDDKMSQVRSALFNLKGFQEAKMLDALERQYYRFTAKRYDRELSLQILEGLHPLLSEDDNKTFANLLENFVDTHLSVLQLIYREYSEDDRRSPLLFQPETILVFLCMERDKFRLKNTWAQFLPEELLEELAAVWGVDLGTPS